MPYEILVHERAVEEIEALRSFEQRQVMDAIEEQLTHQPAVSTRRRKCLQGLTPAFEHVLPVWEIRVGTLRVFYDVDEAAVQVNVRAVRRKERGQTTEEVT